MNYDLSPSPSELLERTGQLEDDYDLLWTVALSFIVASLTGLLAQVRIPLPFTPVPITGQVFGVLLGGLLFGSRVGGVSQFIYLSAGVAGIPWFAGMSAGFAVLAGPTGGFLIGFVLAGFTVGWINEKISHGNRFSSVLFSAAAGLGIIYLSGTLHLGWIYGLGPSKVLAVAVVPFVWVDLIKITLLSAIYHTFSVK